MAPTAQARNLGGRQPGERQARPTPAQRERRIERAVDGVGADGRCRPVPATEWKALRVPAWARWSELPEVRDWPSEELREQGIMPSPPDSAVHDGIVGRALRYLLQQPTARSSGRDPYAAEPIIRTLAEEGLEEIEDFRRQRPSAANSIKGPLKTYASIVRDLRDKPDLALIPEP